MQDRFPPPLTIVHVCSNGNGRVGTQHALLRAWHIATITEIERWQEEGRAAPANLRFGRGWVSCGEVDGGFDACGQKQGKAGGHPLQFAGHGAWVVPFGDTSG